MATNQPNTIENPDDVMRRFLPEMKKMLNIEDLILYLLSENAIGDDDVPKLTVSGQLSKPQVLMNLQQIIITRGAVEQFLFALKRSSEDHTGHKELYDVMVAERQRRMSVSSRKSSTSRSMSWHNSITSQSQLIPESSSQTVTSLAESPPIAISVAESGASTSQTCEESPQTLSVSPSDGPEGTTPNLSQPQRKENKPRSKTNATQAKIDHQRKKSFWVGWLFGGVCAFAVLLVALALTTIVYGSLGIQGKDECGFIDMHVGAYDVSSGALILLLVILAVLLMFLYTSHSVYLEGYCFLIMLVPVVGLAVLCALGIVANVLFSFISIAKVVYGDYKMWNPESINCSSPSFLSAFTYITVELVLILLIIIVCGFLCWYFKCRHHQ